VFCFCFLLPTLHRYLPTLFLATNPLPSATLRRCTDYRFTLAARDFFESLLQITSPMSLSVSLTMDLLTRYVVRYTGPSTSLNRCLGWKERRGEGGGVYFFQEPQCAIFPLSTHPRPSMSPFTGFSGHVPKCLRIDVHDFGGQHAAVKFFITT
jgi:hypothetical protein